MPNMLISLDEASWRLEQSEISGQIFAELLLKSEPLLFGLCPGNVLHDHLDLSRVTSFRAEAENVVIADMVAGQKLNLTGLNSVTRLRGEDSGSLGVGMQISRLSFWSVLANDPRGV
jgi:hypothetical protein